MGQIPCLHLCRPPNSLIPSLGSYFAHCHVFFPILDEKEDTWEAMRQRTPWTIDSILATAASRMPDPSTDVAAAAEHSKEEAEGIARSSLFGPTVRKEGVQAMALLAAFSACGLFRLSNCRSASGLTPFDWRLEMDTWLRDMRSE